MSAVANKKLMQDIFSKLAVGDGSLFAAHLADNVVMRVTGQNSWSRTYYGKESLLRDHYGYFRSRTQEPRKTIPVRFIADDDYVAVEAHGNMMSKSGARYDNEYCMVFKLENGKIVEMREYLDSALCERVLGMFPGALKEAIPVS
jgi:ketosteroid isomerase-like protein